MKKFIGYFDYLGFRDFILNNELEYQKKEMIAIFREIEMALGKGVLKEGSHGLIGDLNQTDINCMNFSDTVIFWTNDNSLKSLTELIEVTYWFNYRAIGYFFPVRGTILFGDIVHVDFRQTNENDSIYNVNSVFGKGVVDAHDKANQQEWAGTVIDESIIDFLSDNNIKAEQCLSSYAKRYKIPYKKGINLPEEYALFLVKALNEEAYKNCSVRIERNFSNHKKDITNPSVKTKLENTLKYLKTFHKDEPQSKSYDNSFKF